MVAKITLAVLIGAMAGMLAASGGSPWPPAAEGRTTFGAKTVACVEAAWHAVRQHRAP